MPKLLPRSSYAYRFEEAANPDAPLLLLLHGTGGDEHDLIRLARGIAPSAALLSPRGDVSERGALRFFTRIGEGFFDPAEVCRRTHALADFISAASEHHGIAPHRVVAVGFSNGANIAATMLQLRPEVLGGAILFRSMVVLDQPAPPGTLTGKRVLLVNGSVDPLVPPDHPLRLAGLLRAGGADVKVQMLSASHGLTPQDLAAAQEWLRD